MDDHDKSSFSLFDMLFIGGLTIAAILIPVFVTWLHFFNRMVVDHSPLQWIVTALVAALALFFIGFNLYTSFIRPWMYKRAHGDYNGYQYVSGAPALGSILVCISAVLLPSAPWVGGLLLALYLIDPGGIHFAAFAILRDCFTDTQKNA
jgi:hypothetical protein